MVIVDNGLDVLRNSTPIGQNGITTPFRKLIRKMPGMGLDNQCVSDQGHGQT